MNVEKLSAKKPTLGLKRLMLAYELKSMLVQVDDGKGVFS